MSFNPFTPIHDNCRVVFHGQFFRNMTIVVFLTKRYAIGQIFVDVALYAIDTFRWLAHKIYRIS